MFVHRCFSTTLTAIYSVYDSGHIIFALGHLNINLAWFPFFGLPFCCCCSCHIAQTSRSSSIHCLQWYYSLELLIFCVSSFRLYSFWFCGEKEMDFRFGFIMLHLQFFAILCKFFCVSRTSNEWRLFFASAIFARRATHKSTLNSPH